MQYTVGEDSLLSRCRCLYAVYCFRHSVCTIEHKKMSFSTDKMYFYLFIKREITTESSHDTLQ